MKATRTTSYFTVHASIKGLDLILYIQNREYVKGIQQGRGMRLNVHEYGTQPFVEESGVSIPTGFQTYVGLRQVIELRKSRLKMRISYTNNGNMPC